MVVECDFQVQISAVLEVLMRTAVSDICSLTERWLHSLHTEIRRNQQENEDLRQRLYNMEQKRPQSTAETQTENNSRETGEAVTAECKLRNEPKRTTEISGIESSAPTGGHWKWNSVLPGAKAEEMDMSSCERKEEKLHGMSGHAVYTPAYMDAEVNTPLYEIKSEPGKAVPGLHVSECSLDVNTNCDEEHEKPAVLESESETETKHIPQHKREHDEEFDMSCLLAPELQLNSTHLLKETQSESTNSDCRGGSLNVDSDLLVTASSAKRFSESTSDSQTHVKFICNVCGKTLATKRSFICHLRLHTGEKPFICTQCGRRFAKKFNLDIHYNVHSGARPYTCTLCPRTFADPSALGRHKMVHRKKSQPDTFSSNCKFTCNVCGLSLSSKTSLAVHFKLHTKATRSFV